MHYIFLCTVLQRHYRQLEAIALEKESVEEVVDLTKSDENKMSMRVGLLLNNLKDLTSAITQSEINSRKRKVNKSMILLNNYYFLNSIVITLILVLFTV